jgi:hypothetical protein
MSASSSTTLQPLSLFTALGMTLEGEVPLEGS